MEEDDYDHYFTLEDCLDCLKHNFGDVFHQTIRTMLIINCGLKVILQIIKRLCGNQSREILGRVFILLAGLLLIFYHFDNNFLIFSILIYSVIGVSLLNFRRNLVNNSLWIYIFVTIMLNESLYYFGFENNYRLRIHFMCLSMKLVSLRATLKKLIIVEEKNFPNFINLVTYLIHPQSLPFGGYFHPNFHQNIDHYASFIFLKQAVVSFIKSWIFLGLSDCLMPMLVSFGENLISDVLMQYLPSSFCLLIYKLFMTYCTALEFRLSHYFICFLIQSVHNFWGYESIVAKPSMVELPRSLVDVVIAWDIPMHQWLKEYVYKPSKDKFGWSLSIFVTYVISSFIHGFRFEIWSVLISLGLLTWIETKFRHLLASTFDSCIEAKSCSYTAQEKCNRQHKFTRYNSLWIPLINLGFSLIAMFHLAYLGSSFNLSEQQTSTKYVFETWFGIGFYSHIIGLLTIIFYYLVK